MASRALDYRALLASTLPQMIHLEEDYQRFSAQLQKLLKRGENLTDAETKLLGLLGLLVQDYERRRFHPGESAGPREVLLALMEAQGVKPKDVWELFGSRGVASEVLNGKRSISKAAAKKLARRFHVSVEVFF